MNDHYYKQLMEDSPIGYAYHRIICDKEAIPYEYEFIEGNVAFEKLTGLIHSKHTWEWSSWYSSRDKRG